MIALSLAPFARFFLALSWLLGSSPHTGASPGELCRPRKTALSCAASAWDLVYVDPVGCSSSPRSGVHQSRWWWRGVNHWDPCHCCVKMSECPIPPLAGSGKTLLGSWVPSPHQVHSPGGLDVASVGAVYSFLFLLSSPPVSAGVFFCLPFWFSLPFSDLRSPVYCR